MTALSDLAARLAGGTGVRGKAEISIAVAALGIGGGAAAVPVGDDCAALPDADGGWTLFACEGLIAEFVAAMPWFAGWSGVMVNLSDVAAMGGRPVAVVNALWAADAEAAAPVLAGMRAASEAYGVPIVGGHTNLHAAGGQLAVAVLGKARALLTSFAARPGDALMLVADLRGSYREPYPFFDAATTAPPERLRGDLEVMAALAESGLAHAAKDVSQGGVIGTAMMLSECSGVGAEIEIDAVPCPDADLARWLTAFPSFGYLIAAPEAHVAAIAAPFRARGLTAAVIGRITDTGLVTLRQGAEVTLLRDLAAEPLIGCGPALPALGRMDAEYA